MIDKLTPEQEAKIKLYYEKRKEIGFSSKRREGHKNGMARIDSG